MIMCPAPKGNRYWMVRLKDGREKDYTPEELAEAVISYFEWCDKNPYHKMEAVKSGVAVGEIIKVPTMRPYLKGKLCEHLHLTEEGFDNYGKREGYEEYFSIYTYAMQRINSQNLEGGYVGAFDSGLVARKLGLADKQEMKAELNSTTPINITIDNNTLQASSVKVKEPESNNP